MYVLRGKWILLGLIIVVGIVIAVKDRTHQPVAGIPASLERIIRMRIDMILTARAEALITGDVETIKDYYDLDSLYGRWAFEHEMRRCKYLQAWSAARGIRLLDSEVEFRISSIKLDGTYARIQMDEGVKICYKHESAPTSESESESESESQSEAEADFFGIGTEHWLELVLKDGEWLVRRDWYLDPLDSDASSISLAAALSSSFEIYASSSDTSLLDDFVSPELTAVPAAEYSSQCPCENLCAVTAEAGTGEPTSLYNRENAVAYADKYCGLAWGCGNDRKYNPAYKNYTGLGGDCTNFASQVLGDPEAGNLSMTHTWRYNPYGHAAGASAAWAQASSLLSFLLASGRAQRIARGTYSDLIAVSEAYPQGAIAALDRGDLIAYEQNGKIAHFAVVVGADSGSYLLVNSHTADRYHVPWDLGWDSRTIFWLLRIVM